MGSAGKKLFKWSPAGMVHSALKGKKSVLRGPTDEELAEVEQERDSAKSAMENMQVEAFRSKRKRSLLSNDDI